EVESTGQNRAGVFEPNSITNDLAVKPNTIEPMKRLLCAFMLFSYLGFSQAPDTRLNPTVKQIVDAISEQRIKATLQKLESFGTRYVLSAQDDPVHGIGAAKRWIHDQMQSYSPRLEVAYQNFTVKK